MRHYVLNVYFGLFGIHNAVHPAVPRCTKRLPLTDTLKVRVICSAETQYTCAAYICQQKIKKLSKWPPHTWSIFISRSARGLYSSSTTASIANRCRLQACRLSLII